MAGLLRLVAGRGTWVLFVGVFTGLGLQDLARLAAPLLTPCIALLLFLSFLRVDWQAALGYAKRPLLAALVVAWLLVASPVLVWLVLKPLGLPEALTTALVLMAAAPPILGSTAIAILLGLDSALSVLASLLATLIAPLTIPPLVLALLGLDLEIGLWSLMGRLMLLVFGALAGAILLRRLLGRERLRRGAAEIDGLIVLLMLVFAVAIMDGVTASLLEAPQTVALWILAAFVANPALQAFGTLTFSWLGRRQALTMGLASGNRNMVLILAVLPAGAESLPANAALGIVLFFALAQFPMYTLPALQRPLYLRLLNPP